MTQFDPTDPEDEECFPKHPNDCDGCHLDNACCKNCLLCALEEEDDDYEEFYDEKGEPLL